MKIGWGFSQLWRVENRPLSLLHHHFWWETERSIITYKSFPATWPTGGRQYSLILLPSARHKSKAVRSGHGTTVLHGVPVYQLTPPVQIKLACDGGKCVNDLCKVALNSAAAERWGCELQHCNLNATEQLDLKAYLHSKFGVNLWISTVMRMQWWLPFFSRN